MNKHTEGTIEKYGCLIHAIGPKYCVICELSEPCPKGTASNHVCLQIGSPDWDEAHANGDRIVAAWNAVQGLSTEAIEAGVIVDALAVCRALAGVQPMLYSSEDIVATARAVVAKLEGADHA
jgi:hypothetical protein